MPRIFIALSSDRDTAFFSPTRVTTLHYHRSQRFECRFQKMDDVDVTAIEDSGIAHGLLATQGSGSTKNKDCIRQSVLVCAALSKHAHPVAGCSQVSLSTSFYKDVLHLNFRSCLQEELTRYQICF